MINIIEMLTNQPAARPGTKLRKFTGITIHDTGNTSPTADAKAHAVLLVNRVGIDTSWHYSVDQGAIYRSIPEDEVAWHAGDGGSGPGNNETISIESCINIGNDYDRTMVNMADLCADILFRKGIKTANPYLFQHNYWSGKNCPQVIRARESWDSFKASVQSALDALHNPPVPEVNNMGTLPQPIKYFYNDPTDPVPLLCNSEPNTISLNGQSFPHNSEFDVTAIQDYNGHSMAKTVKGWASLGTPGNYWATPVLGEDNSEEIAALEAQVANLTSQNSALAAQNSSLASQNTTLKATVTVKDTKIANGLAEAKQALVEVQQTVAALS